MRKITEDEVLQFYRPLVLQECKNSYKGLEWEDRISEGNLALLHAIRTYRIKNGCFKEYAAAEIRRIMQHQNTKAWSAKRLDSRFSLDASLDTYNNANGRSFSPTTCLGATYLDDSILNVNCFIESLPLIEKIVIRMCMDGLNVVGISNELVISLSQVQSIIDSIKQKITTYYSNDFVSTENI